MEKKKQNHTEDNFSLYTFNRLVPENSASDISMYDWRICVIGLHEKGMELAKAFTTNFPTIGFDFAEKQNQTSGETPSNPQPSHSKRKKPALKHGVRCTTDTEDIKDYNFYVINLPDFSDADDQTISDYKKQLSETIGRTIACGDIVVCETLTDFSNCLSVVEQISGLKRHEDFFVGIGPRPLLVQYLPLYNSVQKRRHNIRPGITGWAQVNGRNAISWQQKFEYDVWYVDNLSLLLDIKILFMTIKKVFVREGISSDTSVTMEAFKGNS